MLWACALFFLLAVRLIQLSRVIAHVIRGGFGGAASPRLISMYSKAKESDILYHCTKRDHLTDASEGKLTALHFAICKAGLKTGQASVSISAEPCWYPSKNK